MAITDELREWAHGPDEGDDWLDRIDEFCDRIDAEHEADVSTACRLAAALDDDALAERGYIALPVDADGVPIRVGDEMAFIGCMTVDATDGHNVFFFADNWADGVYCVRADELRHYRAPTVEDVLWEFHERMTELGTTDQCVGVERADAVEVLLRERAELVAEYAAKLRLAEGEDA